MTYKNWLNIWLENYIKPSSKVRTYIRYSQLIRTHIAPQIGEIDVNDLTPIVLQSFVTELLNSGNGKTGKGLSANTVNAVISVMQNSLRTAHLLGYAREYTANMIKRPKLKERKIECFTATCDLKNQDIFRKYESKIIFDYPLSKFRDDLYSKEIKTLRTDSPVFDRSLQAVLLSQYRLKVFQDYRLNIKPVILLKSHRIKENANNMAEFIKSISQLTGTKIQEVFDNIRGQAPVMQEAYEYFVKNSISFEQLAQEIKEDFSAIHCISANDDKEIEKNQLLLNSLEDIDNPYRAVFAVDKLNEGWDVLNLFDIVRLYETRDGKNGKPGTGTISEAQLIGRGARYCPFKIDNEQPKYQRKYDDDVDNQLRICETLYYHCWNEPRYISELHTALREIGLDLEGVVNYNYILCFMLYIHNLLSTQCPRILTLVDNFFIYKVGTFYLSCEQFHQGEEQSLRKLRLFRRRFRLLLRE